MKKYTKNLNLKLTENEFNALDAIRKSFKISISKIMRGNIPFLVSYYKENK